MTKRRAIMAAAATLALAATGTTPAIAGHGHHGHHGHDELQTVVPLNNARGVDALGGGRTLVTESDGVTSTFSLVLERGHHWRGARHGSPKVIPLGELATGFAPAIAAGRHGTVWLLTGAGAGPEEEPDPDAPEDTTSTRLFKWRWGWDAPVEVADIGAYQVDDPDPYDLEDLPADSNPFGLAALRDGSVLVADAAGNDLLHVSAHGDIETVARLMPREVVTPEGLPGAGTSTPAEAVATSVTVGKDGYWYVGELRGYPATAGTSEIWRIRPGTTEAVCDPEHPWGACSRYADGLTSLVDLGAGKRGIYAVTLSKMTWLAAESDPPVPGAEIGGLYLVKRGHHHGTRIKELVPDQLTLPAGVDVADDPYLVGPIFGPGALMKID